jgi:O-antigen/teichoic acid export membrane protein
VFGRLVVVACVGEADADVPVFAGVVPAVPLAPDDEPVPALGDSCGVEAVAGGAAWVVDWPASGSWYWSLPALWASANPGAPTVAATQAVTIRARVRRTREGTRAVYPRTTSRSRTLPAVREAMQSSGPRGLRERLAASGSGTAAALAAATLVNSAIQLVFTIAVTRILGKDDYGALAALVSAFLILLVAGQALQATVARAVALEQARDARALADDVYGWIRALLWTVLAAAVAGVVLRGPLAAVIGTPEHPWGAAAVPAVGVMWFIVCVQRGVLQGLQAFRPIGVSIVVEAALRLVIGIALAVVAGVSGAFVATLLCFAALALGLARELTPRLEHGTADHGLAAISLPRLLRDGWLPIGALVLVAVLQNVDVILARHRLGHGQAGSYAVAAVAAKAVVWVAIGAGLQVLPQAIELAAGGLDPRPVLRRALAFVGVVALPALAIFTVAGSLVLRVVFGADTVEAADALVLLGVAMTLLAMSYLAVQFMIALGDVRFLAVLGVVSAAEIAVLAVGDFSLTGFAAAVAVAQAVAALPLLALALRRRAPATL